MKKGIQNLFILYWLKKTKAKNGKSAIYLRLTINKKRVELSTNLHVHPGSWDAAGQFVKGKTNEVKTIVIDFKNHFPDALIFAIGSTPSRTRLYQMNLNRLLDEVKLLFQV